jgi:hypothetical protein
MVNGREKQEKRARRISPDAGDFLIIIHGYYITSRQKITAGDCSFA